MTVTPESIYSTSSQIRKYVLTFILCYGHFVVGCCFTFLNPLVLDLSYKFGTSVDQISVVFTVILASCLVTGLLGAAFPNFFNRHLYVVFHLALLAAAFFILPHATSAPMFLGFSSLIGLGAGGASTVLLTWMIDVWRHESAPYILSQHFMYSVGTLVPPLLLQPFLVVRNENTNPDMSTALPPPTGTSDMSIPFYAVAGLVSLDLVMHCGIAIAYRNKTVSTRVTQANEGKDLTEIPTESVMHEDSIRRKIFLITLSCLVIGFYTALELNTSQFLPTFSHFSEVKLAESEGAQVLLAMQLGFSLGRLAGIFLVLKIAPHFLFAGNFSLVLVSNTILYVLGGSSVTWLWVGSISMGVGMSVICPVLYAYIQKYIHVNFTVTGLITVTGGFVSAVYPLIVGSSVENNPRMLTYVNFLSLAVCGGSAAILFWATHIRDARKANGYEQLNINSSSTYGACGNAGSQENLTRA